MTFYIMVIANNFLYINWTRALQYCILVSLKYRYIQDLSVKATDFRILVDTLYLVFEPSDLSSYVTVLFCWLPS